MGRSKSVDKKRGSSKKKKGSSGRSGGSARGTKKKSRAVLSDSSSEFSFGSSSEDGAAEDSGSEFESEDMSDASGSEASGSEDDDDDDSDRDSDSVSDSDFQPIRSSRKKNQGKGSGKKRSREDEKTDSAQKRGRKKSVARFVGVEQMLALSDRTFSFEGSAPLFDKLKHSSSSHFKTLDRAELLRLQQELYHVRKRAKQRAMQIEIQLRQLYSSDPASSRLGTKSFYNDSLMLIHGIDCENLGKKGTRQFHNFSSVGSLNKYVQSSRIVRPPTSGASAEKTTPSSSTRKTKKRQREETSSTSPAKRKKRKEKTDGERRKRKREGKENKKKRRKRKEESSYDEADTGGHGTTLLSTEQTRPNDELELTLAKDATELWKCSDTFFVPPSAEDIKLMEPLVSLSQSDPIMKTPLLGPKYYRLWEAADSMDLSKLQKKKLMRKTHAGTGPLFKGKNAVKVLPRDDFTLLPPRDRSRIRAIHEAVALKTDPALTTHSLLQRVMGAIIEVPPGRSTVPRRPKVDIPGLLNVAKSHKHKHKSRLPIVNLKKDPTSVEGKLYIELQHVGLIPPAANVVNDISFDVREDDEVCITIRETQAQIQTVINNNNDVRVALTSKVDSLIGRDQHLKELSQAERRLEDIYRDRRHTSHSQKSKILHEYDQLIRKYGTRRALTDYNIPPTDFAGFPGRAAYVYSPGQNLLAPAPHLYSSGLSASPRQAGPSLQHQSSGGSSAPFGLIPGKNDLDRTPSQSSMWNNMLF